MSVAGSKGQTEAQAKNAANAATAPRVGQAQNPGFIGPSQPTGYNSGFGNGTRTFDKSGNVLQNGRIITGKGNAPIFAGTSYANKYFSERGVANTGQVANPELFAKANFSEIGFDKNASLQASSLVSSEKPTSQQISKTNKAYTVNLNENLVQGED